MPTDLRPKSNILILTVGLPYSGKSTWAVSQPNRPIVCPDAVRLALHGQRFAPEAEPFVWATAKLMVRALFLAGHSHVIVDATNLKKKYRDDWKSEQWQTWFKIIPTSKEVCLERAQAKGDDYILPVIERMAGEIEALDEWEQLNTL